MADFDIPEADALEQAEPVVGSATAEPPPVGPGVPEADALEQAESVLGPGPAEPDVVDAEVPVADALEQAQPATLDDDADGEQ
ncbi:MAG: hypothetical protein M3N68_08900 [Actinomycetota bacterium]|nr:hypothetical protein [Actinomycetota bacterium]